MTSKRLGKQHRITGNQGERNLAQKGAWIDEQKIHGTLIGRRVHNANMLHGET